MKNSDTLDRDFFSRLFNKGLFNDGCVKSQLLYLHATGGYEKTVIRLIEIFFSRLFNKGLFNDGLIGVSILLLISESLKKYQDLSKF